ncbi:MAG: YceD family protein [Candidatus Omnitrophota bacterium]
MFIDINANEIPKDGLKLKETVDPVVADLNNEEFIFAGPVEVDAKVEKNKNEVTARVHLTSTAKIRCSRCLEWYPVDVDRKLTKHYEVSATKIINLWDDLREDLILNYPVKPLCSMDCKGLCVICGKNLNKESCEHKK